MFIRPQNKLRFERARILIWILSGLISVNTVCLAQTVFPNNFYSKISIDENQLSICMADSIYIDSLILADRSTLKFQQNTILIVENAFIGNECTFDASGRSGDDGNNLACVIIFHKLGSLTINTSGGDGENGAHGKRGANGQAGAIGGNDGENGQKGGNGGDGGNGGKLHLHYSSRGFIPTFNTNRDHAIILKYSGGKAGTGGRGGAGGAGGEPIATRENVRDANPVTVTQGAAGNRGRNGTPGAPGRSGAEGELILKKIPD
jgi:hypothetical protein